MGKGHWCAAAAAAAYLFFAATGLREVKKGMGSPADFAYGSNTLFALQAKTFLASLVILIDFKASCERASK